MKLIGRMLMVIGSMMVLGSLPFSSNTQIRKTNI